jgi:hypothetical protein
VSIGQRKPNPRGPDRQGLIGIQGTKPNTWPSGFISYVSAEIQFQEIGNYGQRWKPSRPDPTHEKRDDSNPCTSLKVINRKSDWEALLNFTSIPPPVKEKQLSPTLVHNRTAASGELAFDQLPHHPITHLPVAAGEPEAIPGVAAASGNGPGTITTFAPTPTVEKSRITSTERMRIQPKLAGLPIFRSSGVP